MPNGAAPAIPAKPVLLVVTRTQKGIKKGRRTRVGPTWREGSCGRLSGIEKGTSSELAPCSHNIEEIPKGEYSTIFLQEEDLL